MLLRHIRYLTAVVDNGSFTRAAQVLHVSQPALSQQIKELEDRLGAQLLDRSGRQVRPTDRGAVYLRYVRHILEELDEAARAVRDVEDLSTGSLRLGVTPTVASYLIGPLVQRFRSSYPGISLSIRVASQQEEIELKTENSTLSFKLEPGKTIRFRFVDANDNPLPGVFVGISEWRGNKALYNHRHPNVLDTKIPVQSDEISYPVEAAWFVPGFKPPVNS